MLQEDSKSPKLWDIEDPFIYAPARPDSDPWSTLLRPELEKDKKQCDIWVDEVQNLLIFAGLFSAVVTAFLVESYKNLQPDPNDIIIGLLSQIAIRMESQNASTLPVLNNASFSQFSPTASSVRVNVFWFISLVLSLTTVLVGIVSLQWLQEHRSYPGLSSREIYTLLHMRTQSLEAWRVPLIFATMPLFLQSALVLFLIGLIDFLAPFGIKIVAPVSITIGITMFFLIYTTLCPAFQGAGLYLWFKSKCLRYPSNLRIPTPCPYKSPQARVAQNVAWYFTKVYCQIYGIFQKDNGHHTDVQSILALICEAYEHSTTAWKPFDIVWLSIRDEYMRGSQGFAAGMSINMKPTVDRFPIIDVVRALQHTIRTIGKERVN